MNKVILQFVFICLIFHSNLFGQTYASIGVSVNILPRIEVIEERSLNFGSLSPGDRIVIDSESDMAGCFSILSDKYGIAIIDFELPEYLECTNGNRITIDISDAVIVNAKAERFNPKSPRRIDINRNQKIQIGGTINIPEDIEYFGQYYGEIRLIVEY